MRYKLSDFIEFNPTEKLPKGFVATEIDMASITPFQKFVCSAKKSPYRGGMKFRNNDTIMARITPCLENGKTAFISGLEDDEVGFGSTEYIILRAKEEKTTPEFVYYLAISSAFRSKAISLMTGTSGRQRVQTDSLMEYEIDLPDLETQKKIVRILSALDNKIELNNQQNQTLNRALDELYNEYEASALRKELLIPAKQLFTFEQGVEPGSKAYYSERLLGMVNFYRVGDMCEKCKNFINSDLAKGKILQKNDVVVSFDATIGRIAYGLEGAYSTGMKKISISNEYKKIVSNSFIYAYFRNKNTQDVMSQCAKGTTILHASSAIDSLAVPYDKNLLPELSKKSL